MSGRTDAEFLSSSRKSGKTLAKPQPTLIALFDRTSRDFSVLSTFRDSVLRLHLARDAMETLTQEASAVTAPLIRQTWPTNRGKRRAHWISGTPAAALQSAQTIFDEALRNHLAGRIAEAIAGYQRAILAKPDYAEAHNNLATAFLAQGRLEDAVARYRRALSLKPDYAEAHSNLAVALIAQGKIADGVPCYERAIALNPGRADIHYNLGIALASQGRTDEAAARYRHALALKPDYAEAHNNLGNLLAAQNNTTDAGFHFAQSLAIDPRNFEAHNNMGNAFRDQGRFDLALSHYSRAIEIRPASVESHYNRAMVKTFQHSDADLNAMEELAARGDLQPGSAPFIHSALAKALEDCGDYDRAFAHLREGNDLKRARIHYDEAAALGFFKRISAVFDCGLFNRFRGAGDPSLVPVFVLGMPRSGSTLIEQILASHPKIHGAGELEHPPHTSDAAPFLFPESVLSLDGDALARMGRSYVARLPPLAAGRLLTVNKLPNNFLYIGLIRLILPNARIIHTVRNPIDTCLSCYSTLFTSGQLFSYDLRELGRYYRGYNELMTHWRSVLAPGAMLDVVYEDVVDDLEGQARRLIDYCGLPWDNRCLDFHTTHRPVYTASAVQVRQPLFRGSIHRWRKFEAGLGPLLDELGDLVPAQVQAATAG
jgi:tetratricopeptide (TPR) repeat protein